MPTAVRNQDHAVGQAWPKRWLRVSCCCCCSVVVGGGGGGGDANGCQEPGSRGGAEHGQNVG